MTAPTKAELREALETALAAMEYVGGFYDDRAGEPERTFMRECCDRLSVLRAFLDSGLTDDERETVRELRLRALRTYSHPDQEEALILLRNEIVNMLAPVAEGK